MPWWRPRQPRCTHLLGAFLVCRMMCAQMFIAGSMLNTPDGPRPVESLRAGDLIYCRALDGSQQAVPLQSIQCNPVQGSAEVWLDGHLHFFARDQRLYSLSRHAFVQADQLTPGESLAAEDGHAIVVDTLVVHEDYISAYRPIVAQPIWLAPERLRKGPKDPRVIATTHVLPSTRLLDRLKEECTVLPWQPSSNRHARVVFVIPLFAWGAAGGLTWVSLWTVAGVVLTTALYEATQATLQAATDWCNDYWSSPDQRDDGSCFGHGSPDSLCCEGIFRQKQIASGLERSFPSPEKLVVPNRAQ